MLDVGAVLFGCCVEIMSCGTSVDYGGEDTIFRIEIPDCVSVRRPFSLF